jgi:macrolide transport system ATP-binding/permease protein
MTMLGIVIGIASVVTVASIGQGIRHQISKQINRAGDTLITIRPGADQKAQSSLRFLAAPRANGTLSETDVATVRRAPGIVQSSPLTLVAGDLKADHGAYTAGPVVGAGDDLPQLVNQTVAFGTFFHQEDEGEYVAVIGAKAAIAMFDREVPLGSTFTFRGHEFMVRGVFNEFPPIPLSSDISYNDAIFIPYSTARQLTKNGSQPYEILAKTDSKSSVDSTATAITSSIRKNHGGTKDFAVLKASDNIAATSSVLDLLTKLTYIAAAISLFVGGIGIMNISLVSVTERLHEIGIRKAVGATNRQILGEFMSESVLLCIFGAIFGVFASLAINLLLRIFTSLQPVVQWQVIVGSTLISVIVGVLFGSVPALKAARKDPIAALRGE